MSQYIELLVTLGFLGAMMWGMMKFLFRDFLSNLNSVQSDVKELRQELKEFKHEVQFNFQRTEARIDHLYEENNRLYHLILEKLNQK